MVQSTLGFTQARPSKANPGTDTSGNLPAPRLPRDRQQVDMLCNKGAMSGGIQGLISGMRMGGWQTGVSGAVAGVLGGLIGNKVGYKYQSFPLAMASGAGVGVVAGAALQVALGLVTQNPTDLVKVAAVSLMGGMTGLVGALGGSRRASTRDSLHVGYTAGVLAESYTHNPLASLAGAAGAGVGGRQENPIARVGMASLVGGALGALSSAPYFLAGDPMAGQALIEGLAGGAAAASAGVIVGPTFHQVMRNTQDEVVSAANSKLDPWLEKNPLGTKGKMAAGAALGALTLGSFGMLGPVVGVGVLSAVAVTGGVGAAIGTFKVGQAIRQKEKMMVAEKYLQAYIPAGRGIHNVLLHLKHPQPSEAPNP